MEIIMFIKAVDKKYSKSFIEQGELYFNTVSWFRDQEKIDPNIGDSYENASYVCAGEISLSLQLEEENAPIFDITDKMTNFKILDSTKACLYSLYSVFNNDKEIEKQFIEEYYERDFYTILNPSLFVKLVCEQLERHENVDSFCCQKVEYYSYDPKVNSEIQCVNYFKKRDNYDYQKEFRFYVKLKKDEPIVIHIGNISNIVKKLNPETKQIYIKRDNPPYT